MSDLPEPQLPADRVRYWLDVAVGEMTEGVRQALMDFLPRLRRLPSTFTDDENRSVFATISKIVDDEVQQRMQPIVQGLLEEVRDPLAQQPGPTPGPLVDAEALLEDMRHVVYQHLDETVMGGAADTLLAPAQPAQAPLGRPSPTPPPQQVSRRRNVVHPDEDGIAPEERTRSTNNVER